MDIAIKMNKDGDHFLKEEYCYFDRKVKQCKNYVTLTASTYHPLAVMEAETENSENIELFWTLFNEAYKVVAGDDTLHFNPKGWCTDMAGANMNGLLRVLGDDVLTRIKSCEFYFKESMNKIARELYDDDGKVFKELCDQMLASSLETTYLNAKKTWKQLKQSPSDNF